MILQGQILEHNNQDKDLTQVVLHHSMNMGLKPIHGMNVYDKNSKVSIFHPVCEKIHIQMIE